MRLHQGAIRMEGTTLVLHLEPVGLPLDAPPADEATLKEAIRGVLLGVAALHRAGVVRGCNDHLLFACGAVYCRHLVMSTRLRMAEGGVFCIPLPSALHVQASCTGTSAGGTWFACRSCGLQVR